LVFRWRKKNDDFEWRSYVRTTILVRRQERRQRADDVKAAAVFGIKQAGQKGAGAAGAGLKSLKLGSLAALRWSGRRLRTGAEKSAAGIALAARRSAGGMKDGWRKGRQILGPKLSAAGLAAGSAANAAAEKLAPVMAPLRQPGLQRGLKWIAGGAFAGALLRAYQFGWDGYALIAASLAASSVVLLMVSHGIGPAGALRTAYRWISDALLLLPGFSRLSERGAMLTLLVLLAITGGVLSWWQGGTFFHIPHFAQAPAAAPAPTVQATKTPAQSDPSAIEGVASVQSGDTVRISGTTIRLDGIEAPDRSQTCVRANQKRWDCAAAARDALARMVRSRRLSCTLTGEADTAVNSGTCRSINGDIASELVLNGHVFAKGGFFSAYRSQESQAQAAKAGLWSGEAQRPSEWRAARWEEAKVKSPAGCPIKGQVLRKSGKIYMLPWSPDYARARIDTTQGERWFCSESEAQSAGFKKGL